MQRSTEIPATDRRKKRHGCLTAWLVLIIASSMVAITLYLAGDAVSLTPRDAPQWAAPVLIALLILQIICVIALFKWKKWGVWGYCAVNATGLIVDVLLDLNMVWPTVTVLVSIASLYGVLHIGNDNKGWPQLD